MTAARTTRAERMAMPLARQVVTDLAAEHGACLRPVQLRRTEIDTGHVEQVLIPCGHTLASVCRSCAERARILRAAQCREGRNLLASEGLDISDLDTRIGELDEQITDAGLRGTVLPARPHRHRSTRRRQDAAPLPRRPVSARTVGKTYTHGCPGQFGSSRGYSSVWLPAWLPTTGPTGIFATVGLPRGRPGG